MNAWAEPSDRDANARVATRKQAYIRLDLVINTNQRRISAFGQLLVLCQIKSLE